MTEKQAVLLPIDKCNLEVRVGSGGVWLSFKTEIGLSATIHVGNTLADERKGSFTRSAINQWHNDRVAQAARMK